MMVIKQLQNDDIVVPEKKMCSITGKTTSKMYNTKCSWANALQFPQDSLHLKAQVLIISDELKTIASLQAVRQQVTQTSDKSS